MPKLDNYDGLMGAIKEAANKEDLEELFNACAQYFTADANREEHPTVKALLENCSEMCRVISFEYYASFK